MLANLIPDNIPQDFRQLNFGFRITGKDVVSLEVKTWKYGWPIGIPYGQSWKAPEEKFRDTSENTRWSWLLMTYSMQGWSIKEL